MAANTYSPTWFETFLAGFSPVQTESEIAFLARHLPLPGYRDVLDLCCGMGRHALPLAARGYRVTGLDQDTSVLEEASRQAVGEATFIQGDMRDLSPLPGALDAAINMWQSFGYFDATTNASVLRQVHGKLKPQGRFVLDIYHRGFFEAHQGDRLFEKNGLQITERKQMRGDRLTVTLAYGPSAPPDVFEWQLYTPEGICGLAEEVGFGTLVVCTEFNESKPATADNPRMQLVLEK